MCTALVRQMWTEAEYTRVCAYIYIRHLMYALHEGTKTCIHMLQSYTHHESLAKEVEAIKIFSWMLPDCTVKVRKPDRFLPAVCAISECAVQAFSPSLSSMYGYPSPQPSSSYCILLTHTVSAPPPPCSHHPLGEWSNQREINWNLNPDAGLTK